MTKTEKSRDRNGSDRNGSDRNNQNEKSCSGCGTPFESFALRFYIILLKSLWTTQQLGFYRLDISVNF